MRLIALVLLLALLFFGLGFTGLHFLWVVAAVLLVFWLAGFAFRATGHRRWYRW